MVHAVDLAVPTSWASILLGWEPLHGVAGGGSTHALQNANQKSAKVVHAEAKDVMHIQFTS
jgi:hypothetical protein